MIRKSLYLIAAALCLAIFAIATYNASSHCPETIRIGGMLVAGCGRPMQ